SGRERNRAPSRRGKSQQLQTRSPWPRSTASVAQRRRRARESGRSSCAASFGYLYGVKIRLQQRPLTVKQNLYDVNIRLYKVSDGEKDRDNPTPRPPGRKGAGEGAATAVTARGRA